MVGPHKSSKMISIQPMHHEYSIIQLNDLEPGDLVTYRKLKVSIFISKNNINVLEIPHVKYLYTCYNAE